MRKRRGVSALLSSLALLGCSPPAPALPSSPLRAAPAAQATPSPASAAPRPGGLRYEVRASESLRELAVEATMAPGCAEELSVDDGAEPFVRDVAVETPSGWAPIAAKGTSWFAPACEKTGCRVRYRFLLADAGRALDDVGVAAMYGDAVLAPPSTWLLHPIPPSSGETYRFHVAMPPGERFVTGVLAAKDGAADTFEADATDLPQAPYSGFGVLRRLHVESAGGDIDVAIAPGELAVDDATLTRWIATGARAVASYYGRFPVRRAALFLVPMRGDEIGYSSTLGNGGASITVRIGHEVSAAYLEHDWVMTHEMLHLAFPNIPREQNWLSEGIATYVEPIARARIGVLSENDVWRGLIRGLPRGLPIRGDRGLDNTPTWGRTYWGGALFCLLADLRIRERTKGAHTLDDALRAVLDAGGDVVVRWTLDETLDAADKALGAPILRELHAEMGPRPVDVDLPALFLRLGVRLEVGAVRYDDSAPLAAVRRAITAKTP